MYCATKFVYMVVPLLVVETAFSRYLENDLFDWLQMCQHQVSHAPGHCPFKGAIMQII